MQEFFNRIRQTYRSRRVFFLVSIALILLISVGGFSYVLLHPSGLWSTNTAVTKTFSFAGGAVQNTVIKKNGATTSITLKGHSIQKPHVAGTYATGFFPSAMVFDPSTKSIWIANGRTSDTVTKRNAKTGDIIGTYAVGSSPRAITYDSYTDSIWVASNASSTVTKISAKTGIVLGTYVVGSTPVAITFDPSTNSIWTANWSSHNVTKISATTGAILGTYAIGTAPVAITFDPSTESIWTANWSSHNVTKLSAATGAVLGTYTTNSSPTAITFDPSTNSMWVINSPRHSLAVNAISSIITKLSAATGAVLGTYGNYSTYSINNYYGTYSDHDSHSHYEKYGTGDISAITFDPVTKSMWLVLTGWNSPFDPFGVIVKISTVTGTVLSARTIFNTPGDIIFDPSTRSVWISHQDSTFVTKLSVLTNTITGTYAFGGESPGVITYDSSTNSIWIANYISNNITKLNITTGAILGTYPVGISPIAIAYDPSTNSIWTANSASSTVTKLSATTGNVLGTYSVAGIVLSPYAYGENSPYAITDDPSTNSIWIANSASSTVTKLSAKTGTILGIYSTGPTPIAIAYDPSTNSIWIASFASSTVTKLSATTGASRGTYSVGTAPIAIAYDPSTKSIWVVNSASSTVTKLNAKTGEALGTYPVSKVPTTSGTLFDTSYPFAITFDPVTKSMWVVSGYDCSLNSIRCSYTPNVVTQLNAATGATISTSTVGDSATDITFDPSSKSLWVTNGYGVNTVTKISIYSTTYATAGTFTSAIINLGVPHLLTTLSYDATMPTGTTITMDVRAGNTPTPDNSWSPWKINIKALGNKQYVQYRAHLSTAVSTSTPSLHTVTIGYLR